MNPHVIPLFMQVQAHVPHQLVPYAWGGITMRSTSATPSLYGTEKSLTATGTSRAISSTQMGLPSALTGNAPLGVPVPAWDIVTNAQDAAKGTMAPKNVLKCRKNKALTPYHPNMWHLLLMKFHLLDKYPSIPHSLQHGFDAGIPYIFSTSTPDNSPSLFVHTLQYQQIIHREFESGRYLGPFTTHEIESLLGPFQTSPLSLVPKPGKPGKYHGVHNFSFPRIPRNGISSINQSIDSNKFPCTWGTFATICLIIWHLPPGSQASIQDITEAYCTVPITPMQWPGLVVKLRDPNQFTINTNNNFGLTSGGGIHGSIADAGTDIFRSSRIGPLSKWVDDHIFFRILREHLPAYNKKRRKWHKQILTNGGRLQDRSRFWYQGETMPDGQTMEFDKDAGTPMQDLSSLSSQSPEEALFTYNDADIDSLSDALGIPWEASKTIPFGHSVQYLGFTWDLQARTVAVPLPKKEKYLMAIKE
jgi:hypothetical protein